VDGSITFLHNWNPGMRFDPCDEGVEVNPDQLSNSSRLSPVRPEMYYSVCYKCVQCSSDILFSALWQKHWYESQKKFLGTRPSLCHACYKQYCNNVEKIKGFPGLLRSNLALEELIDMKWLLKRMDWPDSALLARVEKFIAKKSGN
jgi:hypothetical protein